MTRRWTVVWLAACSPWMGCGRSTGGAPTDGSTVPTPAADAAPAAVAPAPAKTLALRWQRLIVDGGATCPRCAGTEGAIREAARTLTPALADLGIRLVVEEGVLDMATFQGNPSESNRIWIGGRTLEEILGGSAGSSQCCGACGDSECRTLVVDGRTYEAIPATLVVQAALKVAADLLGPPAENAAAPVGEPASVSDGSCGCGSPPAAPAPPAPSCCGGAGPAPAAPSCGAAPAQTTPCCGGAS